MQKRFVEQEPAFVLHTRAYRDSSLLIDFITFQHGVVSVLAKGVRKAKSRQRTLIQPFNRVSISWSGKQSLKTLTNIEQAEAVCLLKGRTLFSGFYINELLSRLFAKDDYHPAVFEHYTKLIECLKNETDIEPLLREFEIKLLIELGYGIDFQHDTDGEHYNHNDWYYYDYSAGFVHLMHAVNEEYKNRCFSGEVIQQIGKNYFANKQVRKAAKRLMRLAFEPLLGEKPLKSRELFTAS